MQNDPLLIRLAGHVGLRPPRHDVGYFVSWETARLR